MSLRVKLFSLFCLLFIASSCFSQYSDAYLKCRCGQANYAPATMTQCCGYGVMPPGHSTSECSTAANGKITLSTTQVYGGTPSPAVYTYSPDAASAACSSANCSVALSSGKSGKTICASDNYGTNSVCDKNSFTSCYYSGSFNNSMSAVQSGADPDWCIFQGSSLYGDCNSTSFACSSCSQSGSTWTCKSGNGTTITGTQRQQCHIYQCLCNIYATYVTCQ